MAEASEGAKSKAKQSQEVDDSKPIPQECFVIMPISDQPGYQPGHFTHVYRDIIRPACISAGLTPRRADENSGTNIIQHEILIQLLSSPVAICDLSSRNPNVMFELGLRQAFDKPVILIQDELTPPIFDISMLRYATYRSSRLYNEVMEDQIKIKSAIESTLKDKNEGKSANSLMKLLSMDKAVLENPSKDDVINYAVSNMQSQLDFIVNELHNLGRQVGHKTPIRSNPVSDEYMNLISGEEEYIAKHMNLLSTDEMVLLTSDVQERIARIIKYRLLMGNRSESFLIDTYGEPLRNAYNIYKKDLDLILKKMKVISPGIFDYKGK